MSAEPETDRIFDWAMYGCCTGFAFMAIALGIFLLGHSISSVACEVVPTSARCVAIDKRGAR